MGSSVMGTPPVLRLAQAAWLGLVVLTLLWDWLLAAGETLLSAAFFLCCLLYLQRFKKKKD